MLLFVSLVLSASASFRCASQCFALFLPYFPVSLSLAVPSWSCGRLWLLRLGYYKLTRAKVIADDWVWLVDHTVQLGQEKCLVILGIRLSCLPHPFRSLQHEDLEPIALLPVKKSNGEIVYRQLEDAVRRTGVPRQIIGDEGPDLKKGIREFRQVHSETIYTYDIKHKTANVLKHALEGDDRWKEFASLAAQTKQQVQQTSCAFVAPRNQRAKARYMNVDILIRWGEDALYVLDESPTPAEHDSEGEGEEQRQCLMEKLGWVRSFRDEIAEWGEMMTIVEITAHVVRTEGLYHGMASVLAHRLQGMGQTCRTARIRAELLDFVTQESLQAAHGERLIGSSEVLESVFGKLKELEGDQAKSGFTGLLLSIAAMVSKTTVEVLQETMEVVPVKKVLVWCQEYLGVTLQAKKKTAFNRQHRKEQKWAQLNDTG
jgi:hypothetical protein